MEGTVVRTKSLCRIVITLKLLMQSIAVEVDGQDLEPLSLSPPAMIFTSASKSQTSELQDNRI
jgi:hypothetical protein